jgi:hypothetical protein
MREKINWENDKYLVKESVNLWLKKINTKSVTVTKSQQNWKEQQSRKKKAVC